MWHLKKVEDIFKELKTSEKGLTTTNVNKRIEKNGYNVLKEGKKKSIFNIFLSQFVNPIIYILGFAALFSLFIGEYLDMIFIIIVVLLDAILGTSQEWRAEKSAENLKKIMNVKAKVIRNNVEEVVDSKNLVVGDIILLSSGDKVPADIRLIKVQNLTVDESLLTGESIACLKSSDTMKEDAIVSDRKNMCFAGSQVMTGRAKGIVVEVASNTEIGKLAHKVVEADEEKSPLVIRMEKFTKQLSILALVVSVILVIILYLKNYEVSEIFLLVVALAVSAIPEGLPAVMTVTLSIAANRMSKRNVIVKKLNAVEGLGSATVIASDKTGTLTLNEQTAKIIVLKDFSVYEVSGQGFNGVGEIKPNNVKAKYKDSGSYLELLVKNCMINNEAYLELVNDKWDSYGDAIDIAFLSLYKKLNIKFDYKEIGKIPYESDNGYSVAFYEEANKKYVTIKGSVEKVLSFVKDDKEEIMKRNNELSKDGYRVIAVAYKEVKEVEYKDNYDEVDIPEMEFLGLVGFIDPVREGVKEAILSCKKSGIKVVMVTGDYPLTAYKIASDLGLVENENSLCTGEEISEYLKKGLNELDNFIKHKTVFSRVDPIQKLEIINSYKRQGEFIAVTGDGVNDAPALRGANIGISMGSGTDVSKDTGSIIITDDNFLSIVAGVEEGRYAYANIRKVIYLLMSCCLAEIMFFMMSIIFNYPVPLLAVQLLWLNLVTEGIQDTALAFEKGEKSAMRQRKTTENIFDKMLIEETLLSGFIMSAIVFVTWVLLLDVFNFGETLARSYIILLMVFLQNIHVFNCRSEVESAFKIPFKNNWFIVLSVIGTMALQIFASETIYLDELLKTETVPFIHMIFLFICSLPVLLVMELFKKYKRSKKNAK